MKSKPPPPTTFLRRLINLDIAVSLHLYTLFHPILPYPLLKSLEISGDGRLFFPLVLSLLFSTTPVTTLTTPTPTSLLLLNLLIGSIFDIILIGFLKHLIQRPRPVYNKNMFLSFAVDHWSFPSGHSSRVSFIATLLYLCYDQVREILQSLLVNVDDWKTVFLLEYLFVIVGVWAAVTSVSRVLLGRHFLLDVFVGACLGVFEGMFVFRVLNYENFRSWFIR